MKRITFSLPPDVDAAMRREARRRRVTVSQFAREALEQHLSAPGKRKVSFIGIVKSDEGDISENFDEYLAASWADDIERDSNT
jgi:hypothetical protein